MATRKYEDDAFAKLVKAIDKKWGHTYIDVKVEEEDDIEELLEQVLKMESENETKG